MTQLEQIQATTRYYSALLPIQYRGLARADATIQILAKAGIADMLFSQFGPAFDLATAVGPQLDILGEYIGVPRDIGPASSIPYYGFALSGGGGNTNGLTAATGNVNTTGVFYQSTSTGQQHTDLLDTAYQFILQLKIILNASDGTLASIQQYLATFFRNLVYVVDNADMTLTYSVSVNCPVPVSVLTGYLPKPMGVGITVNTFGAVEDRVLADGVTVRVTAGGDTRVITTP